jgi:hypothetical protein
MKQEIFVHTLTRGDGRTVPNCRVQRARACRPNQPDTPDHLRPLGEVSLWSFRYGSVPSLLVVSTEWVPARAKRNCTVGCNDGSVNLERGVSKEEREMRGTNRHYPTNKKISSRMSVINNSPVFLFIANRRNECSLD